jgi:hypothetical protein
MSFAAAFILLSFAAASPADTACVNQRPQQMPAAGRQSPLDSLTFDVGKSPVKVCYGRPSLRGRAMLGTEHVPYGKLWRTGANEPTIFYTPIALQVAGIRVPPGVYSLYTVPGKTEWEVIVNRSISQWGHESRYTDSVKAQEVGRGKAPAQAIAEPIEAFTIRAEPVGSGAASLILEWEKTRVRIPVKAG